MLIQELRRKLGRKFDQVFAGFKPSSPQEISDLEAALRRRLPKDFKTFLTSVGWGVFRPGFGLYSPDDIRAACFGPLAMMFGRQGFSNDQAYIDFYVRREASGKGEPPSTKLNGVELLDYLQIGSDGCSCYFLIYVGDGNPAFGFCRITPEKTLEDRLPSFADGLIMMIKELND